MQTRRSLISTCAAVALAATASVFMGGCASTITPLSTEIMPENPSRIYTVTARIRPNVANYINGTLKVQIVIDGQVRPMLASALGSDLYEFDYLMPAGRSEATYYILSTYKVVNNGVESMREIWTDYRKIKLTNRYVFTLESVRGPSGARIALVGRGFSPEDVVYFEEVPAKTVFESANALSFYVPSVPAGRNYALSLVSGSSKSAVGSFRVDGVTVSVSPTALALRPSESVSITFNTSTPAPAGGLLIDVTTDAAQSIVMPEVIIPGGATSVTVVAQGGKPGSGKLFVTAGGMEEVVVPFTVSAN